MRKLATLLVALGLTFGLIGAGVAATFSDSVTATQNIEVGTLACEISHTTAGVISSNHKSVTYDAPKILSSAAASAPFTFTVQSTGDIPAKLHVTQTTPGAPFTSILASPADVVLQQNDTHAYTAGLQWGPLGNDDMGDSASITYTVDCNEVPAVRQWSAGTAGAISPVFPSTNAANETAGWLNVTVLDSTITVQSARLLGYGGSCIEYRFNNNTPDQKRVGSNPNTLVTDGFWPTKCIGIPALNPTATITIPAGVTTFEVRSAFGAESGERFDWTRFNLLP